MIDFSTLPFSEAKPVSEGATALEGVLFTFHENKDEHKIYNDLNKRLSVLEASLEVDKEELASIQQATGSFRIEFNTKEEVLLRVDWLSRLYEVKKVIKTIDTKEYAEQLRTKIASVQTCPMKSELMDELNSMVASLPSENTEHTQMLPEQELMEKAIEEAGEAFINLGKAGRDFIISDVLIQLGKKATIKAIQDQTQNLEQSVEALTGIKESRELVKQLESLPFPLFHALPIERKGKIVETLLEKNTWNGLASLDRMIAQLNKTLTKEEQEQEEARNTLLTSDAKVALTLNIKSVEDGRVQLG